MQDPKHLTVRGLPGPDGLLLLMLLPCLWVAHEVNRALPCPIHGDLEPSFVLARALRVDHPGTWFESYRNLGYAALIRLGLVGDWISIFYLRAISLICAESGVLALIGISVAALPLGSRWLAAPAILSLPIISQFAVLEAPDVPAWALSLMSVAVLAIHLVRGARTRWVFFLSGLLAGIAYLFRQQSILLLPPIMMILFIYGNGRKGLPFIGVLVLGWTIGALPQLCSAASTSGNPFHSNQWDNVRFAVLYRDQIASREVFWAERVHGEDLSVRQIANHWWREIATRDTGLFLVLAGLALAGTPARTKVVCLLLVSIVLFARMVTAVVWLDERVGALPDSLARVVDSMALWVMLRFAAKRSRWAKVPMVAGFLVVSSFGFSYFMNWWIVSPPRQTMAMLEASRFLERAGFGPDRRVVTFSEDHDWFCRSDGLVKLIDREPGSPHCSGKGVVLYAAERVSSTADGCIPLEQFDEAGTELIVATGR